MAPQLFPEAPAQAPAGLTWYELHIPLSQIDEAPGHNPRKDYGDQDGTFAALVESIRERGMQQWPRLWPVADIHGDWDPAHCRFTIVSGHRRIAAARALGWESVRACVPDAEGPALASYTETDKLVDALVENLQRRDLNCIEVAEGIGRLEAMGRTQEQIAKLIGRSQGRVSRCVRLLELPEGVRSLLRLGQLTQTHGEELIPLIGSGLLSGEIERMAEHATLSKLTSEGLGNVVRERLRRLGADATLANTFELGGESGISPATTPLLPAIFAPNNSSAEKGDCTPSGETMNRPAKETNGLTRGESDRQFAEAMAPDPDVIPLSERPTPVAPAQIPASAPQMHVVISGLGAEALLALSESEPYKGHSVEAIVEAILVRRAVELGVMESPAKAKAAVELETEKVIHSASVAYCYPQGDAWQGGGAVDMEDGVPSHFDDLAEAREFARERSARPHHRRFLFHVLDHLVYPQRKSDRAVMRGDLWYFRGQQVPGGISNSIPSAENLAEVGCVLEDLCKEAQDA